MPQVPAFCLRQPVFINAIFCRGQTENKKTRIIFQNAASIKTLLPSTGFGFILSPAMNRCRMQIFYSGHVQGIGFRHTAKTAAAGFEITGIVRNLSDSRVELVAEGEKEELEAFREVIRAGMKYFIRDENINWSDAQNEFRGFEIVR
jgi:acylphosphatase